METIKKQVLMVMLLTGLLSCNNMDNTKDVRDTTMITLPPANQDTATSKDSLTVPAMPDTPPTKPGLPPTLKQ